MFRMVHPTKKNVYLWGLVIFYGLILMVTPAIISVSAGVERGYLIGLLILLGYALFKAICGIIFNRFYTDGGILSVAFVEICFFGLFLSLVLA